MKELLPPAYTVKERGKVTVKGKGEMLTYWVESKANRIPPTLAEVRVILDLLNNILVFYIHCFKRKGNILSIPCIFLAVFFLDSTPLFSYTVSLLWQAVPAT